jgi:nitrogen fixation-related uncharacterized protein
MEQEGSTNTGSSTGSNSGGSPNTLVMILAAALVIAIIALVVILIWAVASDGTDDSEAAPPATEIVTTEQACLGAGGTYISEHNECEFISAASCEEMGGAFDECGSSCRHEPADTMCTANCVPLCTFR